MMSEPTNSKFKPGEKVKAKFRNGSMYPGTIVSANATGTYVIKWDSDGTLEQNEPEAHIQAIPIPEIISDLTREMQSQKRYMENYLPPNSRIDLNSAGRYFSKLQELFNGFKAQVPLLGQEGEAEAQKWQDYIDNQTQNIQNIRDEEQLKEVTSSIDRTKYWLDGYVRDGKVNDAERYFGQLESALKEKDSILQSSKAGQEYLAAMDKYKAEIQVKMVHNKLKETASNILYTVESNLRWLNSYKERGETDRAAEYWKKAQDAMAPILADDRYQELQNVKDTMIKFRACEESFSGDIDKMKRQQALEKASNDLKSKGRWLTGALNDKHLDNCSKYSTEFRPMFDEFENGFGAEPGAKDTIIWGRELLERVATEVGPMINKREADAVLSPGNFNLRWLNNSLDEKNEHRAVEYRDKLQPNMDSLRDPRYTVIPEVAEFLRKADEAMQRMENELGDIIAGKEIAVLANDAANQLRYLESYLNAKAVDSIQIYLEKTQKVQAALQKYGRYPEAKEILTKIDIVVQRVDAEMGDIISNNSIQSISNDLSWPLKNLERAIENREVGNIIQGKERVLELSAALVPFSSNPAAKPILDRVQTLLGLCEGEVASIIVDSKVAEIQTTFNTLLAIVKQAESNGDARVVSVNSLKLATLVYPLRVQYGRFPKVQAIIADVDKLIQSNGVKMNEYQKQKFDSLKASLAPQVASLHQTSGNQLANGLKELNKQLQTIRKQSLNDPEVLAYLMDVDSFNLKVFGRIPAEDEYLPIVELDMKAPYVVQNAVKACNKAAEEINRQLVDCKTTFSKVDVTGATLLFSSSKFHNAWLDAPGYLQPSLQMNVESAERAVKAFEENEISALKALDPNCPALSIYPDSIEHIFKTTKQWKVGWPAAINYGMANAAAQAWLTSLKKVIELATDVNPEKSRHWGTSASSLFGFDTCRDFWRGPDQISLKDVYENAIKTADEGIKAADAAKKLREDHPEANLIGSRIEKLKNEALAIGQTVYENLIKHEVKIGGTEHEYEYQNHEALKFADTWLESLKSLNPSNSSIGSLAKSIESARTWLSEAKARKEAAEKAMREAEAAERAVKKQYLLQKWKTPFSGGVITTLDSTWRYEGDGTLRWMSGDNTFNGWSAKWVESDRARVSLDLYFYAGPASQDIPSNFCWLLWESGALECYFHTPTIGNTVHSREVASVAAPTDNNYFTDCFEIKQSKVEGSVPPPIVVAVTGLKWALKNCKRQLEQDKMALRKSTRSFSPSSCEI